jgi:hypothetical protein
MSNLRKGHFSFVTVESKVAILNVIVYSVLVQCPQMTKRNDSNLKIHSTSAMPVLLFGPD